MTGNFIEVRDLSLRIGVADILRSVTFDVRRGERLSIVGPNGAGKTTLLKCINRILTGARGLISVAGRPITEYSHRELATLLGYVPQADGRFCPFTVRDFVLMARYAHFSPFSPVSREDREHAWESLTRTGMERFAERPMSTLSGGERQKVYIAAALAQSAEALLLDEPATFLDPRHQAAVYGILDGANARGTTIVAVTHDINGAAMTSDRILALKEGGVAFCGPVPDFMNNEVLRAVFDKEFDFMDHPRTGERLVTPEGRG